MAIPSPSSRHAFLHAVHPLAPALAFTFALLLALLPASPARAQETPVAFVGATIHPVSGPVIEDGVLVVRDGVVVAVGAVGEVSVPDDAAVEDVSGSVIVPGLVDTHTHLAGAAGGDGSAPLDPAVRQLDVVDPGSPQFAKALAGGITTVNQMSGSGLLMSGQTVYLKLRRDVDGDPTTQPTVEDWLFCDDPTDGVCGGMKMANGTNSLGRPPQPGTRAKSAALQRALLLRAQEYRAGQARTAGGASDDGAGADDAGEAPARDLELEAVAQILDGSRRVHFHSHSPEDIGTVLRLAREFGFTPVIHHGSGAWLVADEIAAAGVPVSVTIVDAPGGKEEALTARWETARILDEAGVAVAINTDDWIVDSRFFLRAAAFAVRGGLSRERALEAVTLAAARMLDLEERIGSLEPGKDADLVILSGDPFATGTRVLETWVEGRRVFDLDDPEDRRIALGGFGVFGSDRAAHGHGHSHGHDHGAGGAGSAALFGPHGEHGGAGTAGGLGGWAAHAGTARQGPGARFAVRGEVVHPVAGPPLEDGVVLVEDGRIRAVGPAAEVAVPEGWPVLEAAHVTPGLVDPHATVGLSGSLNLAAGQGVFAGHDQEQLETSEPIQPELSPVDAYDARELLVGWLRSLGTTTAHTGHGPGALASGQTMIVKLRGETVEEALFDPERRAEMIAMTLGGPVLQTFDSPGTRPKAVAVLRQALLDARRFADERRAAAEASAVTGEDGDLPRDLPRNLRQEALADLLDGELRALVTANRAVDILAAIRLAEEFGYDWVLDGAAEAYRVLDAIEAAGVPVILHPPMARAVGDQENARLDTAVVLAERGIPFTIGTGYEAYVPKHRVTLFEAATSTIYGVDAARALEAVTLGPARLLGIDDRVGSLEPGKDADLVLYDGAPFEHVTRVCTVVIDGVVVSDGCL